MTEDDPRSIPVDQFPDPVLTYAVRTDRPVTRGVNDAFRSAFGAASADSPVEAVLEELVANAIEHNDRPEPRVGIAVGETADGVVLEVRDDGPGTPDRERAVLLGEEETPLHHGSGLGLWLVRWGMTRLGGDVTVDGADPRGSIVAVWLPDRTGGTRRES